MDTPPPAARSAAMAAAHRDPTLQDIADLCDLTKATVSMGLRGDPRVRPETRERIAAAAARLGYDPQRHDLARRMAARRHRQDAITGTIALALPGLLASGTFFTDLLRGALDELRRAGRTALVLPLDIHGRITDPGTLAPLRRGDVDGAVVLAVDETVEAMRRTPGFSDAPVVKLINPSPGCALAWADEAAGAAELAGHLLALGHRRFALSTLDFHGGDGRRGARHDAFRAALARAGLGPDACVERTIPSGWLTPISPEGERIDDAPLDDGAEFVSWIRARPEVTAYVALNDVDASHAWYACQRAGLDLPRRLSVTGFDGTCAIPDPGGSDILCTVRLPLTGIGRIAVRTLLGQLAGVPPAAVTTLPAVLRPGASAAAPG